MMVSEATLKAQLREDCGKGPARRLRAAGRIPAVVYGDGDEAQPLAVDAQELNRLFSRISVENTVIDLSIEEREPVRVLVREVQTHPFRPEILHVDFYRVRAGERITVEVPIRLVGTPVGVREGGILDQNLHALPVRVRADRIPEEIEVDVSELKVGDALRIEDLAIPAGVEVEVEGDRPVCSVTSPTVAALETTAESPEGVGGEVEAELTEERGAEPAGGGE